VSITDIQKFYKNIGFKDKLNLKLDFKND